MASEAGPPGSGGSRGMAVGTMLAALALCVMAAPATARAAQEGGGGLFSVNVGLIVWTWVLFLLTLGVLAWKVFPMIAGGLEQRQRKIQESIDAAKEEREEANRLLEEHRRELAKAREEAQRIVDEGRKAGERLREEILGQARQDQEDLMERTRRELKREREQMASELRREAVEVSLAAAERLVRERLDSEANRQLVEDYLTRMELG